ncbi:MAG: hypothetical protein Q9192_003162 [Flavoplaca navasiana]
MNAAKVEVAFWWDVCDVCRNFPLLTQFPYLCRRFSIIDGRQNYVHIVQVRRVELPIDIVYLALRNSVIRVEHVEDPAGSNLFRE